MTDILRAPSGSEFYEASRFRDAYTLVDRIMRSQDAPNLMTFGPSICDLDLALEERYIEAEKDFKPELKASSVTGLSLDLEGSEYTLVSFFFKQGGNQSASKEWLGNLDFKNSDESLGYVFYKNGAIEMKKREHGSKWMQQCVVREAEVTNLIAGLVEIKRTLTARQAARFAVS